MIFALGYSIVSIIIFFIVYLTVSKKWSRLRIRKPLIFSVINFLLTYFVLALFLTSPALFSSNVTIGNKVVFLLFSIFATYFYFFIIPLSGLQLIVLLKDNLYEKSNKRYIVFGLNLLTIAAIMYISVNLF